MLLDEPFGALDAKVRKDLRRWLKEMHKKMGLTSIFVTHDQEEALELADRVVVMDHGVIEQVGTAEQVYMEPASPFVSHFVGETNHLPDGRHVRPHDIEIVDDGGEAVLVDNIFRKGGAWRVEATPVGDPACVVDIDVDASQAPPLIGDVVNIRARRSKSFPTAGAQA